MNGAITVYGAPYSVYVRIVRLQLLTKGIDYKLESVDVFDQSPSDKQLVKSLFGKIPLLRDGDFELYETGAITRYINDRFPEPPMMPDSAQLHARANQVISIIDNYGYPSLVWGIYVPLSDTSTSSPNSDIEEEKGKAELVLQALNDLATPEKSYLLTDTILLPDLYVFSVLHYFLKTDIGNEMIARFPRLSSLQKTMEERDGFASIMEAQG